MPQMPQHRQWPISFLNHSHKAVTLDTQQGCYLILTIVCFAMISWYYVKNSVTLLHFHALAVRLTCHISLLRHIQSIYTIVYQMTQILNIKGAEWSFVTKAGNNSRNNNQNAVEPPPPKGSPIEILVLCLTFQQWHEKWLVMIPNEPF